MDNNTTIRYDGTATHFGKLLAAAGFSEEQIRSIGDIAETVCHHCWDAPAGCQCWNDE